MQPRQREEQMQNHCNTAKDTKGRCSRTIQVHLVSDPGEQGIACVIDCAYNDISKQLNVKRGKGNSALSLPICRRHQGTVLWDMPLAASYSKPHSTSCLMQISKQKKANKNSYLQCLWINFPKSLSMTVFSQFSSQTNFSLKDKLGKLTHDCDILNS